MDVNGSLPVNKPATTPQTNKLPETPKPPEAPAEVKKSGGGIFGFIGDVFVGGGEAILDMGKGLVNTVLHPIQTIKGLGYVITHPSALVHAFVDPYMEAVKSGHPGKALGRGIVEIGSMFVSPSQVVGAAKGATQGVVNFIKGGSKGSSVVTAGTTAAAAAAAASAKSADYAGRLTNGAAKVQAKADLLAKAGKAAEAAKMAEYAQTLTRASAIAAAGEGAKALQVVQTASKASGMVNTFKAANAASKAAEIANAAGKVGDVAAKAGSVVPGLTKTAAKELSKLGITDQAAIEKALKAAKQAYTSTKNLPGMTATQAKTAAAAKAAQTLGIDASSVAAQKMANAVSLSGAAATTVAQGTTKVLADGTKIASGIKAGEKAALAASATEGVASVVTSGAKKIGKMTVGDIVKAPKTVVQDAGKYIGDAAQKLGTMTVGDIIASPITVAKKAGELAGKGLDAVKGVLSKGVETIGQIPSKVANVAGHLSSVTVADILKLPAAVVQFGIQHPRVVLTAGLVANRLQNIPEEAKTMSPEDIDKLTPAEAAQIAQKYSLDPALNNVKSFLREIATYPGNTIGPDSGTPEDVQQLQSVLKTLGYPVEPTGTYDENTANSIVDFKTRENIKQQYSMNDGKPAINEYVDQITANMMMYRVNAMAENKATEQNRQARDASQADRLKAMQDERAAARAQGKEDSAIPTAERKPAETAKPTETVKPTETAKPTEPYSVKAGDSLSKIAKEQLGDANRWREIYDLNKATIGANPNKLSIGMKLNVPAKPAEAAKPAAISDENVKVIAEKYGVAADRPNVEAFVKELQGYQETAIGPDVGDEEGVKQLQTVLKGLGYAIEPSGKFDDATADAVIDFKKKNNINQTYALANGEKAINEYVGETTAEAMVKKLQEMPK
ncbi:MAG TPA: hypothetical protein DD435_02605 [Cyanobacteria bacterium UBA8530]|nr:hypothetical protein [Cyanobacteria bacterium UBA8530]